MLFSGLKIRIAATLFVLIGHCLLLGNLVFLAFWQRAMIRTEVEHVEAVLDNSQQFLRGVERVEKPGVLKILLKNSVVQPVSIVLMSHFYDNSVVQGLEIEELDNKVSGSSKKPLLPASV